MPYCTLYEKKYLCNTVKTPTGAFGFILRPKLQSLLLFLEVHQVPLILKPGLSTLPKLQEESDCIKKSAL